jgi:site-specific DNA-methyltransferase (cytosine-N4-specific)
MYKLLCGDVITVLKTLADQSTQCCVTSPPYYGLRDYGTGTWIGGDPSCLHRRETKKSDGI